MDENNFNKEKVENLEGTVEKELDGKRIEVEAKKCVKEMENLGVKPVADPSNTGDAQVQIDYENIFTGGNRYLAFIYKLVGYAPEKRLKRHVDKRMREVEDIESEMDSLRQNVFTKQMDIVKLKDDLIHLLGAEEKTKEKRKELEALVVRIDEQCKGLYSSDEQAVEKLFKQYAPRVADDKRLSQDEKMTLLIRSMEKAKIKYALSGQRLQLMLKNAKYEIYKKSKMIQIYEKSKEQTDDSINAAELSLDPVKRKVQFQTIPDTEVYENLAGVQNRIADLTERCAKSDKEFDVFYRKVEVDREKIKIEPGEYPGSSSEYSPESDEEYGRDIRKAYEDRELEMDETIAKMKATLNIRK